MILTHAIVAVDDYGKRLKTVHSTFDWYEAQDKLSELRCLLDKRKRTVKGRQVCGYEMVSGPL